MLYDGCAMLALVGAKGWQRDIKVFEEGGFDCPSPGLHRCSWVAVGSACVLCAQHTDSGLPFLCVITLPGTQISTSYSMNLIKTCSVGVALFGMCICIYSP